MVFKKQVKFFLLLVLTAWSYSVSAQTDLYQIDRSYNGLRLTEFISKAEQQMGVHFYYNKDSLPSMNVSVNSDSLPLVQVLRSNLKPHHMFVFIDKRGNVFLTKETQIKTELPVTFFSSQQPSTWSSDTVPANENYLKTKNEIGVKKLVVGTKSKGAYKEDAVMSGYITGGSKNTKVLGATLYFEELKSGTVTDANGFYSVQMKKGRYTLVIKSLEFEEKKFHLEVYSDAQVNFSLEEKISALKEVVIVAEGSNNLKTTAMGYEKITAKSVKNIPKMMGENDLVKTTLLLPGVQSVGEGTAGFNVRGGSADQNVFYLNQIPVYNTSHLMGFFSAFTPNAISELTLYKGTFPAQFGGHLSSVFDITAREGNNKKFSAEGGISPVSANLLAEGPISKNKSSYLVGVRSTYSDWALKLVNVDAIRNSRARFRDGIANLTFGLNDKNRLHAVGYYSKDHIILASLTDYDYENAGGAVKWNRFIKQKHNFELSAIYSTFSYNERNSSSVEKGYKTNYALDHLEGRTNLSIVPNGNHHINVGANSILYKLDQGNYGPLNDLSQVIPVRLRKEEGLESSVFINEEWKASAIFSMNVGLRYNFYTFLGPHDSYVYKDNEAKKLDNILDTVFYPKNKKVKSYSAPDLRISAKYAINEFMSVKASYNQAHQYIFMLSNTIAISPTDKWKLVDEHIKPMKAEQFSLAYFTEFKKLYEFSVEGYYKNVYNLVEYKDGANLLVNKVPETDVLQGDLNAYGAECMLKKVSGRLNGWVSYTYSRAIVSVNSQNPDERINFGNSYPANYDKPHALNFVANYKFSHRLSVSSNIVYATGRPITYPAAVYYQNGIPIVHYSARNEFRIPDYFRIDLSLNIEGNLKSKKFKHSSWNISVYNLLGRDNPYSIYFKQENVFIKGYQLSIFGSPIFSVTYNFKLGSYEN